MQRHCQSKGVGAVCTHLEVLWQTYVCVCLQIKRSFRFFYCCYWFYFCNYAYVRIRNSFSVMLKIETHQKRLTA